ncbi:hypothetical protein CHE29_18390 [Salmonella enterica]|nr:hypothetical protein CHE29_18390 [Salmonella enterica]
MQLAGRRLGSAHTGQLEPEIREKGNRCPAQKRQPAVVCREEADAEPGSGSDIFAEEAHHADWRWELLATGVGGENRVRTTTMYPCRTKRTMAA